MEKSADGPRTRSARPSAASTTLADVADHAGVSTATVSRALNSPDLVSERMRERVTAAVRELRWVPNGAAKALVTRRTRTIGAIIPTFGHQGIAAMVEALQIELARAENTLLTGLSRGLPGIALRQVTNMIERGIDALVLFGEDQPEDLMDLIAAHDILHVIAYTSGSLGASVCIGFDNYREMAKLTEHLLGLGHRRFALIARDPEGNDRIRHRIGGIHDTLAREGIAIRPQHVVTVDHWAIGSGRDGMRTLLGRPPMPTAVICTNDYLAAGALIEARAAGLDVPGDVSIVGFDDLELAGELDPPLTTIRTPSAEVGTTIARYLIASLEGRTPKAPATLDAELIVRGSTAPPSSENA